MRQISKKLRQLVFDKYGGRCAYCGQELGKNKNRMWNVDHIHPKRLSHWLRNFDMNSIDNLNPSCRRCNIFKGGMQLELFRSELQKQVFRLRKNPQFKRALDYGQITIHESPINFYYEKLQSKEYKK